MSTSHSPSLSIVVPTCDRPVMLREAVDTALAQTFADLEVIVADDASTTPLSLPDDPRLRVVRLPTRSGGAAARNAGTAAARGRWITYLDDDDWLEPDMAQRSLDALAGPEAAALPSPVGVVSGIAVVDPHGRVVERRLPPPSLPRGGYFALEDAPAGASFNTKQTLVVAKDVIDGIGGWDASFRSRVHTDLFLRLNPVCSLLGLPVVTYRLRLHDGPRVSGDPALRQLNHDRLLRKHAAAFAARPAAHADFVYRHALTTYDGGEPRAALAHWGRALRRAPLRTTRRTAETVRDRYFGKDATT